MSSSSSLAEAKSEGCRNVSNDIEQNLSSQIDKLDLMILKAEKAETSMSAQRKQMKHYLAK